MCSKNIRKIELKKILIIGAKKASDNLLLTPSIKKIRETFPNAKIDIVTSVLSEELLVDSTIFEEQFFYDKENIFKFIRKVRGIRYDLIVAFHLPFLPYILRGKYKLSFFLKSSFSEKVFTHESERMLNFIEPFFGKENNIKLYFNSTKKNKDKIEKLMKSFGIKNSDVVVVVNPGKLGTRKNFNEQLFIEIIEELFRIYDLKTVIVGTHLKEKDIQKILYTFKG
ncbi:hypothetical protein M0P98_03990, partial [bacterium]|nr:hypothetical protein [bacterium]